MGNYFQTALLSAGDVTFASPYMAVLKPLLVAICRSYNARSIKPTHYNWQYFKNYKLINANKKKEPEAGW